MRSGAGSDFSTFLRRVCTTSLALVRHLATDTAVLPAQPGLLHAEHRLLDAKPMRSIRASQTHPVNSDSRWPAARAAGAACRR